MSQLLPKSSVKEFQLKEYWDSFFSKRSSAFEWYGEYTDLCHLLHKYLRHTSRILMAGCGNSKLSEDLYDAGFKSIDNIDISSVVIRQKTSANDSKRSKMTFTKMDILDMEFEDAAFDCVLDKGTLDAIFSSNDIATVDKVDRMFAEIERVLKITGRYICVTLAQDHILEKLLECFGCGWLLRVHKVKLNVDDAMVGGALPVFVFVCTKMARREGMPDMKVYEYVSDGGECVRCGDLGKVGDFVRDHQQYAMIEQHLTKLHIGEASVQLDMWSPSVSTEPRYSLAVVDQHKRKAKSGAFAVFIVPQGREVEWLFSTDPGRQQLAESAGFERLVVVTMHRGHTYPSLEEVKEEVAAKAMELAQQGLPHTMKYPVLSLGEGLGSRVVLHEGSSPFSGGYIIEECEGEEGGRVRRLIFLNNPALSQTEVNVIPATKMSKKGKKKTKTTSISCTRLDHSSLASGHHNAFVASLVFLSDMFVKGLPLAHADILLVGLGGGALPQFMNKYLCNITLDVVEIDSEMLSVAEKWFGFAQGERLKVFIEDGVQFVQEACAAGKKGAYDAVLLDVDSKDCSAGMSSPPQQFLEKDFLESIKSLLKPSGVLMTNLAARSKEMKSTTLQSLRETFPSLLSLSVPEDVNEIVIALPDAVRKEYLVSHGHRAKDLDLGCCVTMTGHVTESVRGRLASLTEWAGTCSAGNLDVQGLYSSLLQCLSHVHCYDN